MWNPLGARADAMEAIGEPGLPASRFSALCSRQEADGGKPEVEEPGDAACREAQEKL